MTTTGNSVRQSTPPVELPAVRTQPLRDIAAAAAAENFPVAFFLIAPRLRPGIAAFYRYARAADDVADDPVATAGVKLAVLDRFEAGLDDRAGGAPEAVALARTLAGNTAAREAARALLGAFRQDAAGARYATWDHLAAYCALSADPVGRFLLAFHGEPPATARFSDPLCTALQVLNHLQDLRADRDRLGRVYLPADWLRAAGAVPADLSRGALTPAARIAVDRALDTCDRLIAAAAPLPDAIRARGLRGQAAATLHLARRLSARLRRGDPLARRIAPTRGDFATAALRGALRAL